MPAPAQLCFAPAPLSLCTKRPRSNRQPLTRPPRACADELSQKVKDSLLDGSDTATSSVFDLNSRPLPVQRDLLTYHARVLSRRKGTHAAAEALYQRVLRQDRTDGRAWLGIARLRSAAGRVSEARAAFREGARYARGNAHLLQAWGVLEERAGNLSRAHALFLAAVRTDPSHCASWVALGLWEKRHGRDVNRAAECFERGAEADPGNYYVWHVWGVLERERRNFTAARDCFSKGVAANPRNGPTYVVWGALEDGLGRTDAALALFEEAHRVSPRNAHAYVSHAVAAERGGRVVRARELLATARKLRPNDPAPIQAAALLEFRAGNLAASRKCFEAGVCVSRIHAPLWHAWACVERASGNLQRARELFQEAVWAAPKTAHVVRTWHAWAALELSEGRPNLARRYISHGLVVDRRSPALLALLASLEARERNMLRARELMEIALEESPRARFLWREYEQMERDSGHPDKAAAVFERSVVAAQLIGERLTVSPPLAGDFASVGMWIGADDLRGQDSVMVRENSAMAQTISREELNARRRRQEYWNGKTDKGTESGSTSWVMEPRRRKRKQAPGERKGDGDGRKAKWTQKKGTGLPKYVDKRGRE